MGSAGAVCYRRGTLGMRFAFCSDEPYRVHCGPFGLRTAVRCGLLTGAAASGGQGQPHADGAAARESARRAVVADCLVAAVLQPRVWNMWGLASFRRSVDRFMPAASSSVNHSDRRRDQGIRVCMPILTEHVVLILTPPCLLHQALRSGAAAPRQGVNMKRRWKTG